MRQIIQEWTKSNFQRLSSTNFTWSILEYFFPNVAVIYIQHWDSWYLIVQSQFWNTRTLCMILFKVTNKEQERRHWPHTLLWCLRCWLWTSKKATGYIQYAKLFIHFQFIPPDPNKNIIFNIGFAGNIRNSKFMLISGKNMGINN